MSNLRVICCKDVNKLSTTGQWKRETLVNLLPLKATIHFFMFWNIGISLLSWHLRGKAILRYSDRLYKVEKKAPQFEDGWFCFSCRLLSAEGPLFFLYTLQPRERKREEPRRESPQPTSLPKNGQRVGFVGKCFLVLVFSSRWVQGVLSAPLRELLPTLFLSSLFCALSPMFCWAFKKGATAREDFA